MNEYKQAIVDSMDFLARDDRVLFIGQQVAPMSFYSTLENVPLSKRLETPASEELQTGMAIGLALEGYIPISIYQRMDFMWKAADQMFNHLDKMIELTNGKYDPKVILRTTIGTKQPLNVGPQHYQDLIWPFKAAFNNVEVMNPKTPDEVKAAYMKAYNKPRSFLIVENQGLY